MEWIKRGWGEELDQQPRVDEPYTLDFTNYQRSSLDIGTLSDHAIDRITKSYPAPYTLMVSGGIDSQAMMLCWIRSGHQFDVVCGRFNDNLNKNDIATLDLFAAQNHISVRYLDLDIISFLENDLLEYAVSTYCTSPQITAHMALASLIPNGTIIYSGNLLYPYDCFLNYTHFGMDRYRTHSGKSIIPFFFHHDATLAPAALPLFIKNTSYTTSYSDKIRLYTDLGFSIIPQNQKTTGFESVKEYYDLQSNRLTVRDKLEFKTKPSRRVFDILFRYRLTRLIHYSETVNYLV